MRTPDCLISLKSWKLLVFELNYLEEGKAYLRMREAGAQLAEAQLAEVEMMPPDIAEVFTRCDAERERTNATVNEVVEEMWRRKVQTTALRRQK
ncbi:hypothetical protein ZIOFF_042757 [Zingiber officinale]|uniref:Uncharacterized protein n=1 Tax=Zingiber officinale TaxID=94328 RepID=A0A8J5FU05_ZINOF|nr:hypothetical protein ZIOFF_042757 [Zingiber officinale]